MIPSAKHEVPVLLMQNKIYSYIGLGFQFLLCLQRALKQVFRGFSDFVMEMVLHLGCGVVISVAAERLEYVGPYPEPICDIGTLGYRKGDTIPKKVF